MTQPLALNADQHPIALHHISSGALAACRELRLAGFQAYLVGGCVRDLLLGLEPTDFDVATDAEPEQIQPLFRRARIVGRRFKIVHLRFGREVIEVSTFRTHHGVLEEEEQDLDEAVVCPDSGMLLRDNVYGSIEDDAIRRDFTVNSLFYDPIDGEILDYTGGLKDLGHRRLCVIGNPVTRFQEDPVRMLRAIRFMAKLGFELDSAASEALQQCRDHCCHVAPARMFDVVLKLLLTGHGEASFSLLEQYGLVAVIFPQTAKAVEDRPGHREFLRCALANTDERIKNYKPVTPAFLYAALLWPAVIYRMEAIVDLQGSSASDALREAAWDSLADQMQHTAIPRRFSAPMREIWELHLRLIGRRRIQKLFQHPRFRAAYDFILLREQSGETLDGAGQWWTKFQESEAPPDRIQTPARKRRRPRGRRTQRTDAPANA